MLPGLWRIRVPLPWQATPHGNAYALAAGDGIVLVDTGFGGSDGLRQLEFGLAQAGLRLDQVSLIVVTHSHSDHFGCAASVAERTGAPVWIHPAWDHMRPWIDDPGEALDKRLAGARRHGVPEPLITEMDALRRDSETGIDGIVEAAADLVSGVEFETDLGTWVTYETPGHAPSHVVFHQPERRLMLSGDMIGGKVFLYFDHGHSPDPVGEMLCSLDLIEDVDVGLCLAGHGRPVREFASRVRGYRREVQSQLHGVNRILSDGRPRTAFEIITEAFGTDDPPAGAVGYGLEMTMSYLDHLAFVGEVSADDRGDVVRWEAVRP